MLIFGFPSVNVPVLSKTTVSILFIDSNASPPLINTPLLAPNPVPTITAVGVAKPNAHGHAITNTEIDRINEKTVLLVPGGTHSIGITFKLNKLNHVMNVKIEIRITIGTKYFEILSANF